MREINIPEVLQPKLEYYIGLSEAIKTQFVAELSISPLGFTPQALTEHLSAKLPLSNAEISDLVSVAINLISAKDVTNADSGEFVDMLQRALERTDKASLQPSDKILKDFAGLIAINDGTNALATGKVIEQMTDQHKTYLDSKVLHDIRPIIHADQVIGSVMVYQLKIMFREDGQTKEIYFSLDNNDIEKLVETLNKSKDCAKQILTLFKNSNFISVK